MCSAGPARVAQVIREALARGADRAIHVEDDGLASADAFADDAARWRPRMKDEQFDVVLTGASVRRPGVRPCRRDPRRAARPAARHHHHGSPGRSFDRRRAGGNASRQAGARRRLVSMARDADAGRADDPERYQPAALRHAQRDHGGEEERSPQGCTPTGRIGAPNRKSSASMCLEKGKKTQIIGGTPAEAAERARAQAAGRSEGDLR